MLRDFGRKYYIDYHYNCAQAIFLAVNEQYGLDFSEEDMCLLAGFGGGMSCGEACGALTGGISVLGAVLLKKGEKNSMVLRAACKSYVAKFDEHFGGISCKTITPKYRTSESGCVDTVKEACDILEEVINSAIKTR